jgi:ABC-2 type transport system ATP-binding protein
MSPTSTTALPTDLGDRPFAATTKGLTKRFGRIRALDELDLQLPEQAVYVLVGPIRSNAGEVRVLGMDPQLRGGNVRACIGYVPEHHDVGYRWMTVGRMMEHCRAYYPSWDVAYARELADVYEVDPARKCRTLSKGESRRVQLLLALAHRPPLLLLDEPTDGLDHVVRDATLQILSKHLTDSPTTVLISTHRVYEVERLVDHVGVLSEGRLLGQLPSEDLHQNLRCYLADVPEGWDGSPELTGQVIRRVGGAREIEWTVWGEEERVLHGLDQAGATVREVAPLSVDEAATALLSRKEAS